MALSSTTTAKAPLAAGQLLRCTPASLPLVAAPSAARHGFRMHSSFARSRHSCTTAATQHPAASAEPEASPPAGSSSPASTGGVRYPTHVHWEPLAYRTAGFLVMAYCLTLFYKPLSFIPVLGMFIWWWAALYIFYQSFLA